VGRSELVAECTEVVKHQRVRAIKVGALGSEENARAVGDFLAIHRTIPAVVDTVMVPTRGRARLLDEGAVAVLRERVLCHAALATVNAPEAEVLTGARVTRLDEAHEALLALLGLGVHAVLLKGGHLGGTHAVDLLGIAASPRRGAGPPPRIILLSARRLSIAPFHGGGCILASLIAGRIAASGEAALEDKALIDAVRWSKKVHHAALRTTRDVGGDLRVMIL
jgi:hydroxymethylpyrimidine/phosphomethylpyrimidine kinase